MAVLRAVQTIRHLHVSLHDPRHRRRRLHRLQLRARLARRDRRAGRQPRQADLRRQPRQPRRRSRTTRATSSCAATSATRALVAPAARRAPPARRSSTSPPRSHVDRSIDGPAAFVETNVVGTFTLLEAARALLARRCAGRARATFRFLHVSTDEVYGSLGADRPRSPRRRPTPRTRPTRPRRPRPTISCAPTTTPTACRRSITNCSNNYGPYQFPEKLIPLMILNALEGKPLPVYGDGQQRARLAVRRGPLPRRSARVLAARPARARPTTSAATASATQPRRRARRSARCSTSCCPSRRTAALRVADHVRHRPARPRPPLRHRRRARSARELGWRPRHELRRRACAQTVALVPRQPRVGRARARPASYRRERWTRPQLRRARGSVQRRMRRASSWPAAPARGCIRSRAPSASSCCRSTTSR